MRVLIGCEFSGAVRRAFSDKGIEAWSCDILPCEDDSSFHMQMDIMDVLRETTEGYYDIGIFFPPCTHLASSGARWFAEKRADGRQQEGIDFFMSIISLSRTIKRVAVENPVGIMSSRYRKPDQIIQPWMFGHGETKATCLWLKNLPPLMPTDIVPGREQRVHRMPPSSERSKERSRTYTGIAEAMADQYSLYVMQGGSNLCQK